MKLIPGDERIYYSADCIQTDNAIDTTQYADEFLHSLTPPGMPPHRLALKIGAVVMLLRNVSICEGLCNGTRLIIRGLNDNSIEAEIMTGIYKGKRILLPRIQLTPSDVELPFILCRRQFPVRLAYSMTINKSQGQTFNKVGIYLGRPCFTHGQLYVAFSRAKTFKSVKIKVVPTSAQGSVDGKTYTPNVVFKQVISL